MSYASYISVLIVLSSILLGFNFSLIYSKESKTTPVDQPTINDNQKFTKIINLPKISIITDLMPYSPIYIDGNSNFTDTATIKGWIGNGNVQNPFIIDGYNITGTKGTENLISVLNTDLHFIIRNISVQGGNRGIYLSNVDNGTLSEIVAHNNTDAGIYIIGADNINLTNNVFSNNSDGMRLYGTNCNIIGNSALFNEAGGYGYGFYLSGLNNKIFNNNATRNGKYSNSGGFSINGANSEVINNTALNNGGYIDGILGGEGFRIHDYVIVKNNTAMGNNRGFHLRGGEYNLLIGNNISLNRDGFYIWDSSNHNIIQNNFVSNNENGIKLCSTISACGGTTTNNTIKDNLIVGHNQGIYLGGLNYQAIVINNTLKTNNFGLYIYQNEKIVIDNNSFYDCGYGIALVSSNNNTMNENLIHTGSSGIYIQSSNINNITNNLIFNSSAYGISLTDSTGNRIHNNDILYNNNGGVQAYANPASTGNVWSNGTHGNFWSDYLGIDSNSDGIGDSIYNIAGTTIFNDSQPLIHSVSIIDALSPGINTPSDISYEFSETGSKISWIAMDDYPFVYVILIDDLLIQNGTWVSTIPLEINVEGLDVGNYNYTIIVYDVNKHNSQDTVIVIVTIAVSENIGQSAFLITQLILIYCIIQIRHRKKE